MGVQRIFNFSAGPAVLPLPVLEEAREGLISLGELGMGICEISHRSKEFTEIIERTEADIRKLLDIPADYSVFFVQGGASLQFSAVPMNFLPPGATADYILTGGWSKKALAEAKKVGQTHVAATTESTNFNRIPRPDEIRLSGKPCYVHYTSNNTLYGTQWATEPDAGGAPLICDFSSDALSRPIDVRKYAYLYGGAQKNLGPSGVTLIIARNDLLERSPDTLPTMLNMKTMAKEKSLYNTPPTFGIYLLGLVMKWTIQQGGLAAIDKRNRDKAKVIYDAIDAHPNFYRGHAEKDSRSLMNITFRLPSEELEKQLVEASKANKMSGLKGHRSVGGMRASVYNAFPLEGCHALAQLMHDFARKHG